MLKKNSVTEYNKLNPQQKEAVEAIEGPVVVVAGPGTGKTQVLAMRIANILAKTQVNPSNILCLTFTNSGVQAMKERLLEIIGPPAYQIPVFTFHAFCNDIIESFPEKFLIAKKINQLDDLEQIFLIQKILKKHSFKFIKPLKSPFYYQKSIIDAISKLKQENIPPTSFSAIIKQNEADLVSAKANLSKAKIIETQSQIVKNKELSVVYRDYQKALAAEGKYDYNDMILFVLDAFRTDEDLLTTYQEKFQYFLLDEYQDTNSAQNEVVKLLASFYDVPNIFVVGDDEQSIFRFQGASMENILGFKRDYPSAKIIILESSYRSGQLILDASRALITQNKNQIFHLLKINKNLKSQKPIASAINLAKFSSGSVENFFIASKIKQLTKTRKVALDEIAVLFRRNRDCDELIDFFSKLNIPYQLEIGENVLDDPEIGKLITFFEALAMKDDPKYNQLLLEIMHYPFFNITSLNIYKIVNFASKNKKNIFDVLTNDLQELKLDDKKAINDFLKIFFDCISVCHNHTFTTAFEKIIDQTGYLDYFLSLPDSVRHLNRLQTLFKYIQTLNTKQKNLNLTKFLEHLELLQENNLKIKEETIDAAFSGVNLMTAHKAKGLEFDYVFIIHLTDKHWGNLAKRELIKLPTEMLRLQKETDEIEEERRLFYVSLTRARKSIYLTCAESYDEDVNQTFSVPSQFIGEIPSKYLHRIDGSRYEKQFDARLKLTFGKKLWQRTDALNEFLKQILAEFQLNPTALNTFLDCPQRFFYDNILRVPKAKDFTQSFGTAVHFALERFFSDFIKTLILPAKKKLVDYFLEGLRYEILSEHDLKSAKERGSALLKKYYDCYKSSWQKKGIPLALELNFRSHDVHFGDIPISGIIDKIEVMDRVGGKVRIIDYKTSAPKSLNFLLGKTKEKNTDLLYQAYFYKLLAESDPLFNWQVGEIVFDFISDKDFKQMAIPIEQHDYDEFKKLVQKSYQQIFKLDFPKNAGACKKRNRVCDYYNICRK